MKKENGISVGTILILFLSLGVVTLTLLFLLVISGSDFGRVENQKADELPAEENPVVVMDEKAEDSQRDSRDAEAETLPEESGGPVQIALSFVGDVTVTRGMQETLMINDHEYDFTRAFAGGSGAFGEADLSIATLETLINTMAPYDTYNAPPDLLEALKAIGVHHLNLATEHMMDLGFDGLIVESHCDPEKAWSDAKQQVTPDVLDYILSLLVIRDEHVTTESIQQLRKQIDDLDNQLMEILSKRMAVCREIGNYKKEHNMTVLQSSRYNEILEKRGVQGTLTGMDAEFVAKVFESIHEESVRQQIEIVNK